MTLAQQIERMMQPGYDPAAAIAANETARGFTVVRPGQADWLPLSDWNPKSVFSIDGLFCRLVLIDAVKPGTGALTRLLDRLKAMHLIPCVVDPTREFADTLRRRKWQCRQHGSTFEDREQRWTPI